LFGFGDLEVHSVRISTDFADEIEEIGGEKSAEPKKQSDYLLRSTYSGTIEDEVSSLRPMTLRGDVRVGRHVGRGREVGGALKQASGHLRMVGGQRHVGLGARLWNGGMPGEGGEWLTAFVINQHTVETNTV